MSQTLGASAAVMENGRILLTRREDFEVWCLPGGMVEDGETLAQAAVREAWEETGLEVDLTGLVGTYSRTGFLGDVHAVLFAAKMVGGEPRLQEGDTIEIDFFPFDGLPEDVLVGHGSRIRDAIAGVRGIARRQSLTSSPDGVTSRRELYALRDASPLSRREFYQDFIRRHGPEFDVLEVPRDG